MGTKRTSRKKQYALPMHRKKALLSVHLSKELKAKIKKRAATVKKGDRIKVMRGDFKGRSGIVAHVDYKNATITVEGISKRNSKGVDVLVPLRPSNLMIVEKKFEEKKGA
ncbi:MAG: 50S ribosomal protein L24 [Candidatus Anstonellales archaeon]